MGLWNPTLRKVRGGWGSLSRGGVGLQQVPHRAFSPVRNDKVLLELAARLTSCPSWAWRVPNLQRDGVLESHVSQSARDMGHPLRRPARSPSTEAKAPFLFWALCAALKRRSSTVLRGFGAVGLARLTSCPSRAWRFPNPQRDGVVESHVSQNTRDMGHPLRRPARTTSTGAEARFLFWALCAALKRRSSTVLYWVRCGWLVARLTSCPSRAWRFPNPQGLGLWNPALRRVREGWGSLGRAVRTTSTGLKPGSFSCALRGAACRDSSIVLRRPLEGDGADSWFVQSIVSISLGIGSLLARPWKSGPFRAAFSTGKNAGFSPCGRFTRYCVRS
jgi:hypothetical protein